MKITDFTRRALESRREDRRMKALGYRKHETDWEIHRGLGATDQVILDAKISGDGKYVWTKVGVPAEKSEVRKSGKPHIRMRNNVWTCLGLGWIGFGTTEKGAYASWHLRRIGL
jgi:hypothetical protein